MLILGVTNPNNWKQIGLLCLWNLCQYFYQYYEHYYFKHSNIIDLSFQSKASGFLFAVTEAFEAGDDIDDAYEVLKEQDEALGDIILDHGEMGTNDPILPIPVHFGGNFKTSRVDFIHPLA